MNRLLSAAAAVACLLSAGCAVVPVGPRYYGHRPVVVSPVFVEAAPPPVVVQPYPYDGRDRRGRPWRRGY